jgi:starch synthase (maltosyl-transferring)
MTAPLAAQKPVLAGKPTKAAIEGRLYIEDVYPSVDAGRFAVKRIVGEPIEV